MKKLLKKLTLVSLVVLLVWCGTVLADRNTLRQELIRLHVVADSDALQAQQLKLQVRDAIILSMRQGLCNVTDVQQAKAYLQSSLPRLQQIANAVLAKAGSDLTAAVTLEEEAFPVREYETFRLPAGVYESLRIVIGEGKGQNWWCVVFPELCLPTTSEGFETVAAGSGFADGLASTLTGESEYEIRFFLLDCLGRLENFFFRG